MYIRNKIWYKMQRFYTQEYPITSDTYAFILDTYVASYKYLNILLISHIHQHNYVI